VLRPSPTVTLAILTKNEIGGIRKIVPQIPRREFEAILAIDGASIDGSAELMQELDIPVFQQLSPGLGSAMMQARHQCKTTHLVYFHPDGNESVQDAARIATLLRSGSDFVVASRMLPGGRNEEDGQWLRFRKWGNWFFIAAANFFFSQTGQKLTDVTNGLRGISVELFDRMQLTSKDLTLDYQMCIRALKLGVIVKEFPTIEEPRIDGSTHFRSIPTGIAELRLLWSELQRNRRVRP
jgi:hypothetical protein